MAIVLQKEVESGVSIAAWHLTEDLTFIEKQITLQSSELEYYSKLKNDKRKREWLVVRILVEQVLGERYLIQYSPYGKPYISDNKINISVTHSKNYVGLIWTKTNKKIGIDIETISERVGKVKHKFLSPYEQKYCNTQELMTIAWSLKEAAFKIYEKDIEFFDAEVQPFSVTDKFLLVKITKNNENKLLKVYFIKIESDFLTYVILKETV